MKSVIAPLLLAILLAVVGAGFYVAGQTEKRLADIHSQLVTLQYADAGTESDAASAEPPMVQRLIAQGGLGDNDARDAHQVRATAGFGCAFAFFAAGAGFAFATASRTRIAYS